MLCLLLYWFSNFCIHKITDMLTLCNCWEKVATPYNWSMPYLKWLTCPLYSRFLPRHPITKCLFESQMMPCNTPMDTSSQVQLTLAFLNYGHHISFLIHHPICRTLLWKCDKMVHQWLVKTWICGLCQPVIRAMSNMLLWTFKWIEA